MKIVLTNERFLLFFRKQKTLKNMIRIGASVYLRENFWLFMARNTLVWLIKISDSYLFFGRAN